MGLPVTERGGPPGGGGMGRPEVLVGGLGGAEGGAARGGPLGGALAGAGRGGAETGGAETGGAETGGAEAAGAMGLGCRAGAVGAGAPELGAGRGGRLTDGCSDAGRLVMRRLPVRGDGAGSGAGREMASGSLGTGVLRPAVPVPVAAATAGSAGDLAAALEADLAAAGALTGAAGSSGWTGRRSPSRSALRRARSA
jgi:hypothetical protein